MSNRTRLKPPKPKRQPGPVTFWNGEPCTAVRARLRVGVPPDGLHPQYWAAGYVGQVRAAVRIEYGGRTFHLDDEDGLGWVKVTDGRGSPRWPSKSLYGVEVGNG